MGSAIGRLIGTGLAAVFGLVVGYAVGVLPSLSTYPVNDPAVTELVPLPHHVPEHPGGISFRFAMVHDVIHERFPKHGQAHYRERDKATRDELASLKADDPAALPLLDDLAAGLERLGKSAEAVEVMRDKLARQRQRGISGRQLYTTYANLGTFLIHSSFKPAMAGDAEAKARFREGVEFIRESVKVNPEAHFGRERWQAAIAEFLLASMDNPKLLTTFDCLGNRLDASIETLLNRESNWVETGYGRPTKASFGKKNGEGEVPALSTPGIKLDDPNLWAQLHKVRDQITQVGAEAGWDEVPVPSHRSPVPFDEPVLGMIGMWRQGGGANPHFCLAMGETMLRVGQRYIAWAAYERGIRLAERFWPDEAIRNAFLDHCRQRQSQIESTMTSETPTSSGRVGWQQVSPPLGSLAVASLREEFNRELAVGADFQLAYQTYEETKINNGFSINDDHFFDQLRAEHPSIATTPGSEEMFAWVSDDKKSAQGKERSQAFAVLGAGIAACLAACCFWLSIWLKKPFKPSMTEVRTT